MVKYLLFVLILTGCSGLPNFPNVEPKYVSSKLNVYKCVFDENGDLKCDADIMYPTSLVQKHYCVSLEEAQSIRRWVREVQQNYTCKKK